MKNMCDLYLSNLTICEQLTELSKHLPNWSRCIKETCVNTQASNNGLLELTIIYQTINNDCLQSL